MINDASYLRAQAMYDRQEPPEPNYKDCEQCEGKGKQLVEGETVSNCCGAPFYDDTDICTKCKEHADKQDCEQCEGTGRV